MGLRLRFGVGPLRASIPLTGSRSRSRSRRKTYHGTLKLANGKTWKCQHSHQTEQAAIDCANKHKRTLAPAPVASKPRPAASSKAPAAIQLRPLLASLAAVDSADSALAFTGHAVNQLRSLGAPADRSFDVFRTAAMQQVREETERLSTVIDQAKADADTASRELTSRLHRAREAGDSEAEKAIFRERDVRQADVQGRIDAATARMDAPSLQLSAVKSVGTALGVLN